MTKILIVEDEPNMSPVCVTTSNLKAMKFSQRMTARKACSVPFVIRLTCWCLM